MIMWQIASRRPPYNGAADAAIDGCVSLGEREEILDNCPEGYMELVQLCWHQRPDNRPEANEIIGKIVEMRKILNV